MDYYGYDVTIESSLAHYGVPGMKWGVRRYVDSSGNLTNAGLRRYNTNNYVRGLNRLDKDIAKSKYRLALTNKSLSKAQNKRIKNEKKIAKLTMRRDQLQSAVNSGEKHAQARLEEARKNKIGIKTEYVTRFASKGAKYLTMYSATGRESASNNGAGNFYASRQRHQVLSDMRKYGAETAGYIEGTKYKRTKYTE